MDPIKVDFSSNNNDRGQGKSKVVMPPEKKALKIVINIVLTLIAGAVGYYFYLPAFNFKAIEMYIFLGAVLAFYCAVNYITSGALKTPDYAPYAKKSARIPMIFIGVLIAVVAVGFPSDMKIKTGIRSTRVFPMVTYTSLSFTARN